MARRVFSLQMAVGAALIVVQAATATIRGDDFSDEIKMQTSPPRVVILGSGRDFPSIKRLAVRISHASGLPLNMEGRTYNARTKQFAAKAPDFDFSRRDDTMTLHSGKESYFISVEKSEWYTGLKKGYYIIVAGVCPTKKEADQRLARFRNESPSAYAPSVPIYWGCVE